jgi:hypothetical protein
LLARYCHNWPSDTRRRIDMPLVEWLIATARASGVEVADTVPLVATSLTQYPRWQVRMDMTSFIHPSEVLTKRSSKEMFKASQAMKKECREVLRKQRLGLRREWWQNDALTHKRWIETLERELDCYLATLPTEPSWVADYRNWTGRYLAKVAIES